jgi:hypothetical protein
MVKEATISELPSTVLFKVASSINFQDRDIKVTLPLKSTWKMALSATLEALSGRDNPSMVNLHRSEEVLQTPRRSMLDEPSLAGSADLKTPPALPIRTTYDIETLPRPGGASENVQELVKEKESLKGKELLKEKELPEDELAKEEELKKIKSRREILRKLALEHNPFEDRDPYTLTLEPSITEQTIPIIKANVRLMGLPEDGLGLEERLDMADMVWDTGAYSTIICEELLSKPFRQYLKGSQHDQFRTRVRPVSKWRL